MVQVVRAARWAVVVSSFSNFAVLFDRRQLAAHFDNLWLVLSMTWPFLPFFIVIAFNLISR